MSDPFVAEVRMFPFNFAPKGWAYCNGQLLPLSQNTALFSLLGTMYGGDGKSTFALPDLQGRVPINAGQGPGLFPYSVGDKGGSQTVTLLTSEIPMHSHILEGTANNATTTSPTSALLARSLSAASYTASTASLTALSFAATTPAGGDLPHNNMQPYLTVSFCIALQGVFPPRP